MITKFIDKGRNSILIIDDTYGEVELGIKMGYMFICCIRSVIEFYTSKGDDIAKNILKFIVLYSKCRGMSMLDAIRFIKEYDEEYHQYGEQLEKYLLLL
jgi:hypothetical protein